MTLGTNLSIPGAPRVLAVPLAAAGVAPARFRVEPFTPGSLVSALSAAAGDPYGASHPGRNDPDRYASFQVAKADVSIAANVIAQVAASRASDGTPTADLVITLGTSGNRPRIAGAVSGALGALSDASVSSGQLDTIVIVDGVVYGRIVDATTPAPTALQWGYDSDTDAGYTFRIDYASLKVGSVVEIIRPGSANIARLAKRSSTAGVATGAALVAGVAEERHLAIPNSITDTAGRTAVLSQAVNFAIADVGAVALLGLK